MSWTQLVPAFLVIIALGWGFEKLSDRLDDVIEQLKVISETLQTIIDTKHTESETEPYGP